jgi:hypothetical protein
MAYHKINLLVIRCKNVSFDIRLKIILGSLHTYYVLSKGSCEHGDEPSGSLKNYFFLNWCSGGRGGIQSPLGTAATKGLLCQPRVIMMMEKSVEWLAGETEVLGENLPQCRFVRHRGGKPVTNRLSSGSLKCWEVPEWLHNWQLLRKGWAP